MKVFATPRIDAAKTSYLRARTVDRMLRAADRTAAFRARLDSETTLRDHIKRADCVLLHAR